MVPSGFERLLLGHAVAVARADIAPSIRRALVSADGTKFTLHEYASRQPAARALQGRGTAWAVALPPPHDTTRVVVRHNHHGGWFAPITRDRFFSPTRAPAELFISLELRRLGISTPEVLAYAVYPPGGLIQRSDVASREIAGGRDLADVLVRDGSSERAAALTGAARLVAALSRAGARHHDLNAKNVLVTTEHAYVLDVDRVSLGEAPPVALAGNLARLTHSLRKWRDRFNAQLSDRELQEFEDDARRAARG